MKLNRVNHDPSEWMVSHVKNGKISYQKSMPGEYSPNEAAEWVAASVYEETAMEEPEILRIIVSREFTDEHFVFDVRCQPTVDYDSFYIPDKNLPNRESIFMPDYKRLDQIGKSYAN